MKIIIINFWQGQSSRGMGLIANFGTEKRGRLPRSGIAISALRLVWNDPDHTAFKSLLDSSLILPRRFELGLDNLFRSELLYLFKKPAVFDEARIAGFA